jgi:hypothetical protein
MILRCGLMEFGNRNAECGIFCGSAIQQIPIPHSTFPIPHSVTSAFCFLTKKARLIVFKRAFLDFGGLPATPAGPVFC